MSKKQLQLIKQNIGIDVSKDEFEANLVVLTKDLESQSLAHKKFTNATAGVEEFLQWAQKKADPSIELHFTMEATGVYYENLAFTLFERGYQVHVVLPNLAKKYAESLGNKSKTDKLDARSLGAMGVERKLFKWRPASENLLQLKALTRERSRRQKQKTRVINQFHAAKHSKHISESSIRRYKDLITFLKNQVKAIEEEILDLIREDEVLNEKIQKITSVPGLGITTVASVIAETNGFASITNIKQLQSFAGYDPQIRESGKWKGATRISKKGNSHIRQALYFPAYTIIKYSQYHKEFYERILEKRGKSLMAATAVQRKLLGLIYTLWKNDTEFDPDYNYKNVA
jgi:transposase